MVKRQRNLVLALGAVAAGALLYAAAGRDDAPKAPPAAPRAGTAGRGARAGSEDEVPAVGLDRLRQVADRAPVGADRRNVFTFGAPPTPPPGSVTDAPAVPVEPTPIPSPTPTPLPPLNVRYIGSVERKGLKVAVFMTDKKEIVSGEVGQTVMNRFRVVRIGFESVDVQQVGADQVQRLPLKGN